MGVTQTTVLDRIAISVETRLDGDTAAELWDLYRLAFDSLRGRVAPHVKAKSLRGRLRRASTRALSRACSDPSSSPAPPCDARKGGPGQARRRAGN